MNNYDRNIESSYLMYWAANNLYGWGMPQKLRVNDFKQVKKLSKFDNTNKGYILEVVVEYSKKLFSLQKDPPFFAERKKIANCKRLFVTYITKNTMLCT